MHANALLCNVDNGCVSNRTAQEKPLKSQLLSVQHVIKQDQVGRESRSVRNHYLSPKLRATSSHLSRFRRMKDVANDNYVQSPASSVLSECSTITTSTSNTRKAARCHVCSKPPTTAFSQPLIRCVICRRQYHPECHTPPLLIRDKM